MQADIEEVFGFLRQALLIIKPTFICFLFKIITDKLKGILALCTSLVYKEFSELSTPALVLSKALLDGGGCIHLPLYRMGIFCPIFPPFPCLSSFFPCLCQVILWDCFP